MAERPVICLGSAVWDTIFQVEDIPTAGIKVLPSRALQIASGMATSAAITIARLRGNVQLWSRVGDDDIARRFIQDVQGEGVDTGFVRMQPGLTTPFSTVIVDKNGERLVVPYFDPNMSADTSWLPLDRIAGAGAVLADMRWVDGALANCFKRRSPTAFPRFWMRIPLPITIWPGWCRWRHTCCFRKLLYAVTSPPVHRKKP